MVQEDVVQARAPVQGGQGRAEAVSPVWEPVALPAREEAAM